MCMWVSLNSHQAGNFLHKMWSLIPADSCFTSRLFCWCMSCVTWFFYMCTPAENHLRYVSITYTYSFLRTVVYMCRYYKIILLAWFLNVRLSVGHVSNLNWSSINSIWSFSGAPSALMPIVRGKKLCSFGIYLDVAKLFLNSSSK